MLKAPAYWDALWYGSAAGTWAAASARTWGMASASTWAQGAPAVAADRRLELRLDLDGTSYGNADLAAGDGKVAHSLYQSFGIGNAQAARLTATLLDPGPIGRGVRPVALWCRLRRDGTVTWAECAARTWGQAKSLTWGDGGGYATDWVPQGTYYLDVAERAEDGSVAIEAYDWLALTDQRFEAGGGWPKAAADVVAQVAAQVGGMAEVRGLGRLAGLAVPEPGTCTCREVLRWVAAAAAANWTVAKDGALSLLPVRGASGQSDFSASVSGLTETSDPMRLTGVSLESDDGEFSSGRDSGIVAGAECAFAGQQHADAALQLAGSPEYTGYRAQGAHVTPLAELGDAALVPTTGEVVPFDSYSLLYEGACTGEFSAPLVSEVERRIAFPDPAGDRESRRLERIEGSMLTHDDLAEVSDLAEELSKASGRIREELAKMDGDIADARDALAALTDDIDDAAERIDGAISDQNEAIAAVQGEMSGLKTSTTASVSALRKDIDDESQRFTSFEETYMDPSKGTCLVQTSTFNQTVNGLRSDVASAYSKGKRVFSEQPTPPYDPGDLWVNAEKAGTYNLWGDHADTTWGEAAQLYTWGDNSVAREGIYVCIAAEPEGGSFARADWREADDYAHTGEIARVKGDMADLSYRTASWFEVTDRSISMGVKDTLAQAKSYADGAIEAQVTDRSSSLWLTAAGINAEVLADYVTVDTFSGDVAKYAAKADLKVAADAIAAAVAGTEEVTVRDPVSGKSTKVSNRLAAGVRVLLDSITSEVVGTKTVTDPFTGEKAEAKLFSKTVQNSDAISSIISGSTPLPQANQKRRVFTSQPVPPYDAGDLWVNVAPEARANLWGQMASLTWAQAAKFTWGSGSAPASGIYVCATAKGASGSFSRDDWREADDYARKGDVSLVRGMVNDELGSYTTKSEFERTSTSIMASVSESLAKAREYSDGQLDAMIDNRSSKLWMTSQEVQMGVLHELFEFNPDGSIVAYAQESELSAYADAIVAAVSGAESVTNPKTGQKVSNVLSASLKLTQDSITSVVKGEATYMGPDGVSVENPLATKKSVSDVASDLSSVGGRVTAAEGGITTLKNDMTATKSRVGDVESGLGGLTRTVSNVSTSVSQTRTSITSLVQGEAKYIDPDGQEVANPLASKESVTTLVSQTVSDWSVTVDGMRASFGTCQTGASDQKKVVTIEKAALYPGKAVTVYFANANTAEVPSLRVNGAGGTGAEGPIMAGNDALPEGQWWSAGSTVSFVWDGTYWRTTDSSVAGSVADLRVRSDSIESSISSVRAAYGTCDTAQGVPKKVVPIAGFSKYKGATVTVYFVNANTVASPMLRVVDADGKGTAAEGYIYVNGGRMAEGDHWKANTNLTFVWDGSSWRVVDGAVRSRISQLADSITLEVAGGAIGSKAQIKLSANGRTTSQEIDLSNGVTTKNVRDSFANDDTAITISAGVVTFKSNTFVVESDNFSVTKNGTINATAGSIGGWTVDANSISNSVASLASDGVRVKRDSYELGKIGSNAYVKDTTKRGIVFNLNYSGATYMAWSAQEQGESEYTYKLVYANKAFGAYDAGKLHASAPFKFLNNASFAAGYGAFFEGNIYARSGGVNYLGRTKTFYDVCTGLSINVKRSVFSLPKHYEDNGSGYWMVKELGDYTLVTDVTPSWGDKTISFTGGIMTTS